MQGFLIALFRFKYTKNNDLSKQREPKKILKNCAIFPLTDKGNTEEYFCDDVVSSAKVPEEVRASKKLLLLKNG